VILFSLPQKIIIIIIGIGTPRPKIIATKKKIPDGKEISPKIPENKLCKTRLIGRKTSQPKLKYIKFL
jgi:hypothetical protein